VVAGEEEEEDTGPLEEPPDAETDWIELHNTGNSPVNLAGWSLTDDAGDLRKWMFPTNTTIPAVGYLLVLATELDTSPAAGATYLHANFSLSSEGEYLGLVNASGQVVSELASAYPQQNYHHSYGRAANGQYGFFATATPGTTNAAPRLDPAPSAPEFSVSGGFHDGPLLLTLTTTPDATIRYTLDGSAPEPGLLYTGPISITADRVVRARSVRTGDIPSATLTHTYLINETAAKKTLPALCLVGDPALTLYGPISPGAPANGEGVLAIKGGVYDGLLWEADGDASAFNMLKQRGRAVEKPAGLEFFPVTGPELRTDFGLRAAGSTHTRDRYRLTNDVSGPFNISPRTKPSFNLMFRSELGERPLDYAFFPDSAVTRFRDLRLRAGKNDVSNPFIKDEYVRRLFLGTGQQGSIGVFNTVYINGVFKGYFNLCERLREGFMQEHYASSEPWDVQQVNVFSSGDPVHWNKMIGYLRAADLTDPAAYQQVHGYLDVDNYIDYLTIQTFAAMWDWPNNNWVAARERTPQGRWRFHVWDAEGAFGANSRTNAYNSFTTDLIITNAQTTTTAYIPALYTLLKVSPEFQLRFADRVQKHFFNGGGMVKTNMEAVYYPLRDAIRPILEETLGTTLSQSFFNNWIATDTRRNNYFGQLEGQGLWPGIVAPALNSQGGSVPAGFELAITNLHGSGTVYLTMDGADPRVYGTGAVSPTAQAYSLPIPVNAPTTIRARVRLGSGAWSPVVEAVLYPPQDLSGLALTEIMFNPPDLGALSGNDLEFLELKNTGTNTLNLSGLTFASGITFGFSNGTVLAPGAFYVLARNATAFAYKYPGVPVQGTYTGQLDNGGEQIKLSHALGTSVFSVTYDDRPDWPVAPDVADFSLVQRGPAPSQAPDRGNRWRASTHPGGSPGADDPAPITPAIVINEILAHTDLPQKDTIELHNPSTNSVDLSGWFLTDDAAVPGKFRIPDGTLIPAGGYLEFDEDDFNPTPGLGNSFSLSSTGDDAHLFSASTNGNLTGYSHGVDFGASFNGVSFGRHVNTAGDELWPQQTSATPGLPNAGPRIGPVVISEIHYHSEVNGDEFVELLNLMSSPVPLFHPAFPTNTWKLDGVGFTFPTNVTLAANRTLLVVATNPAAFRTKYNVPTNVLIFGPYPGQLQDDGENVALQAPDNPNPDGVPFVTTDAVRYNDKSPWPAAADGGGTSLQRLPVMAFGNEPTHWIAATPTPGQAAADGDFDGDGMSDAWELQNGTTPLLADGHLDADGDGLTNWEEYLAGTHPNDAASMLKFQHIGLSGGSVTLQFLAVSNRTYQVLHKQSLTDPDWLNWTTVPAHPTNRMVTLTNAATEASRLYRLVLPVP